MATFLHKIGRLAFRRRWRVLFLWGIILGAIGLGAANSSGGSSSSFTLPGTESQRANDLLGEKFPAANASGASARVVLLAPDGQKITSSDNKSHVEATLKDITASSSE